MDVTSTQNPGDAGTTEKEPRLGRNVRSLDVLQMIAENHAVRSRRRSALVSGAIAVGTIERYASYLKWGACRNGRVRERFEKSCLFRHFQLGRDVRKGNKRNAKRLALARKKIRGDLSTLAAIAKGYSSGSREMEALAIAAFSLVRVAMEEALLMGHCRSRANMGKPLTARQRKHLQSLGVEV